MTFFLSIDIGTSNIKAALFESNKHSVVDTLTLPLSSSTNTPKEWKTHLATIINTFGQYIQHNTHTVHIIISGHGPSTVYLDSNNNPIHYISWQHNTIEHLEQDPSYYLPQIAFVKNKLPHIFNNTSLILPPAEYLSYLLTGIPLVFFSNSKLLPYMWNKESIARYNISTHILPQPIQSGKIIGTAKTNFAHTLKISHAHVISGGLDYISAKLGAGIINSHAIFQRSGTSVVFNSTIPHTINIQDTIKTKLIHPIPSFTLPGFFENTYNIGYVASFYDQLYHLIQQHCAILHVPKTIPYLLHTHRTTITPITQAVLAFIEDNTYTHIEQIIQHVINADIDTALYGLVYLAILIQQIEKMIASISLISEQHQTPSILVVSGGHAHNSLFMQAKSTILDIPIHTYNPLHTELRGNLYLGLQAILPQIDLHALIQNSTPHTIYMPKK